MSTRESISTIILSCLVWAFILLLAEKISPIIFAYISMTGATGLFLLSRD